LVLNTESLWFVVDIVTCTNKSWGLTHFFKIQVSIYDRGSRYQDSFGRGLETEKPVPVFFEEVKMDCGYRADILVEKQVIVETKSIEGK
jgi:PD-(D/E)XK nuclease superfamily